MSQRPTVAQIDLVLPQTQCGLCTYAGCLPYAQALVKGEAAINQCPPGGIKTLQNLADLMGQDATPYLAEMQEKAKPTLRAVIREAECIGCTKCIQACPVDAIVGAAKSMHSIIERDCNGCELCVAPCPVDCIDMILTPDKPCALDKADHSRNRFVATSLRRQAPKLKPLAQDKKTFLQLALARGKAKQKA